jgi:hypothetical protein
VGLVLIAVSLCAFSAVQKSVLLGAGFALAGVSLLYLSSMSLAYLAREVWEANIEAARSPQLKRDILRVYNTWLLLREQWHQPDNAHRGAFDPAVESLLASGDLDSAYGLASLKIQVAHSLGQPDREKMYRRYVAVLERMRQQAA